VITAGVLTPENVDGKDATPVGAVPPGGRIAGRADGDDPGLPPDGHRDAS
jgi:hypothetical protein